MESEKVKELLSDNLKSIFSFCYCNLYDKQEAEDLTNDIVCEILKSSHRLKDENAFMAFMWKIAENTFKTHIRKKKIQTVEYDEVFVGAYWVTPESEYEKNDQINILRRELSLLSKQYREVTVAHYIYCKTCSEISQNLGISIEMVKYYLFKTRKFLKEGFGMTREFGEKSYNPAVFRMDFWGGDSSTYEPLFERKLPGNIVLAAYEKPLTVQELSIELGVSSVYLEDEIEILIKHNIIKEIGGKYQTNIIIFTDEYEKNVSEKFKPIYAKAASALKNKLDTLLSDLKKLDFYGNNYDDNRLKWTFANIVMYHALEKSDEIGRQKYGAYPKLSNGTYGFVFGYDNDYVNHHFNGIYGYYENAEKTAWVSIENYRIIEKCQFFKPYKWEKSMLAMTDAALFKNADESNEQLIRLIDEGFVSCDNGKLSPKFPVFKSEIFGGELKEILLPMIDTVCDAMIKICETAAETLMGYVPKNLKDKCGQLAHIHYQMDAMAFIIETLVAEKYLLIPDEKMNLCVFGVTK